LEPDGRCNKRPWTQCRVGLRISPLELFAPPHTFWGHSPGVVARSVTRTRQGAVPGNSLVGEVMSLVDALLEKPANLSTASKYIVMNGFIYLMTGALFIVWPGVIQTLFRDAAFVGHEKGLIRVIGLTVMIIGWLYWFGGRTGARQAVAASVVDRLVFVPVVLIPLAIAGVFPHMLLTLAIIEPSLAIGAWVLLSRKS
jgi:hypothetical protein